MMDVSVVIPTRDRPELLALTLRTVLWQEDVDAEVLVVDDGMGPGTGAVLEGLGGQSCPLAAQQRAAGSERCPQQRHRRSEGALDCVPRR